MELNIIERIHTLGMLPAEGNAVTLRVVNELRQELSFSEAEIEEAQITSDPESGRVMWNSEKAMVKDVKIGETMLGVIKDALKKLDDTNKLTLAQMPIYERFMGEAK